jgi:dCTP deaminase
VAFWSKERIVGEQAHDALIAPYLPEHIEQNAYALGVASDYAITTPDGGGAKRTATFGEHITIPPGQFALLLTEEVVYVPAKAMAFISVKAKFKLRGLINVSGFHVDPGFRGRLKFAVYNAGSVAFDLKPGQRLFLIWYADLDQPTAEIYDGPSQGQDGITAEDVMSIRGIVVSAAAITSRVTKIEEMLKDKVSVIEKTLTDEVRRLDGKIDTHQNWSRPLLTAVFVGLSFVLLNAIAKPWLEGLTRSMTSPSGASPVLTSGASAVLQGTSVDGGLGRK